MITLIVHSWLKHYQSGQPWEPPYESLTTSLSKLFTNTTTLVRLSYTKVQLSICYDLLVYVKKTWSVHIYDSTAYNRMLLSKADNTTVRVLLPTDHSIIILEMTY